MSDYNVSDKLIAARISALTLFNRAALSADEEAELGILQELQQHRARIAARAAADLERLSEDELDLLRMSGDDLLSNAPLTHGRLVKAISEIRQRRAADLTPEQLEGIKRMRRLARGEILAAGGSPAGVAEAQRAVDALDAVLRAHGVTP